MPNVSWSQEKTTRYGGNTIVSLIQLEHADAEYLASALEPFLSPEGSIVPYQPTNTLIIRGTAPVVNMLSEVIKGETDVSDFDRLNAGKSKQQEMAKPDR